MSEQIDYIELPSSDLTASKAFYAAAFAWTFEDFGPTYAGFQNAGTDGGIDGGADGGDVSVARSPLVILRADDLEDALTRVLAAGGEITQPIFEFPGGRRFHFRDPSGNELGVWSE